MLLVLPHLLIRYRCLKRDLDVDGHTELDNVNVSAASTFGGLVDINAGAQVNTLKVEDLY